MSRVDSVGIAAQVGAGAGGLGTKKTVMDYYVPVGDGSPGPNTDTMERDETVGHPFPTDRTPGTQYFEPSISGAVRSASAPRLLSPFMGDPITTVVVAAAAWDHVLDPVVNRVPRAVSLLMTRADPNPPIVDLFYDAIGQELGLSVETGDWIAFDAGFVAGKLDDTQPAPSVSADLTRRYAFYECTGFVSIAGGAEAAFALSSFGLTYNLNVPTDEFVLGSRGLNAILPGNRDATVTFRAKQDLKAYYRRALLLEPETVKLRLLAQGPVISGVAKHEFEITANRCFEVDAGADISASDPLTGIDVDVTCAYDAATSKFVSARVRNAVSTYVPV